MGELVFVPFSSGAGQTDTAFVVQDFVTAPGDYTAYGWITDLNAQPFLRGDQPFSVGIAVRILEAVGTQTLASASDGLGASWAFELDSANSAFNFVVDGDIAKTVSVTFSDFPIGRFVYLTASSDGTDLTFYIDGSLVGTVTATPQASAGAITVRIAGGDPVLDDVANLGFFFSNAAFTAVQHAEIAVASQNTNRVELTPTLEALANYALYNVDTGLMNINQWDPDPGSTIVVSMPLVTVGAADPPVVAEVPYRLDSSAAGSGGGGSTGANVGAGTGLVYRNNTGVVLNLRSIINTDGTISITTVGDEIVIDQNAFAIASFAKTAPNPGTLTYERGDTLTGVAVAATYTDGPPTSASLSNTLGGSVGGGDVNPGAWTFVAPYAAGTQPINVMREGTDLGADPTWTIGLSATKGLVDTASVVVRWTSYIYWGADANAGPLVEADVEGLSDSVLSGTRGRTLSVTLANEYFYYCYPTGLGAASYTLYGFAVDMQATYTVSVTNANGITRTYNVDRSTNLLTGTNLPIIVS